MVETFCTSGAVKLKAGANVSTALTSAQYTMLINQAEDFIVTKTGVNYLDTYSALNVDVKYILEDCASSYAAIGAINYDMSGYTSRAEAQTMLDVNYSRFKDIIIEIKDKIKTDFITQA